MPQSCTEQWISHGKIKRHEVQPRLETLSFLMRLMWLLYVRTRPSVWRAWDIGMYAQTLMLAMTANGLASCAQGTMGHYPEFVREAFNLGEEIKVLFGISFGYEDKSMKVNTALTERSSIEDTVIFKN